MFRPLRLRPHLATPAGHAHLRGCDRVSAAWRLSRGPDNTVNRRCAPPPRGRNAARRPPTSSPCPNSFRHRARACSPASPAFPANRSAAPLCSPREIPPAPPRSPFATPPRPFLVLLRRPPPQTTIPGCAPVPAYPEPRGPGSLRFPAEPVPDPRVRRSRSPAWRLQMADARPVWVRRAPRPPGSPTCAGFARVGVVASVLGKPQTW